MLEKNWEQNEVVHQVFMDLKEAYYSIRGVLYLIPIKFGEP
jgi:hypothetical protein